ncbi:hypothetical protein P7C73_g3090, partial [Tremellales sp. Uapishka_1]
MRATLLVLLSLGVLLPSVYGQTSPSSPSSSSFPSPASSSRVSSSSSSNSSSIASTPRPSSNSSLEVVTTTLTSLIPQATGTALPTTLVLTLTLNETTFVTGNDTITTNSTIVNGTTVPAAWNETMTYLPYKVALDPAYGILGGVLILSGIPVAVLGGKNRWSSLAIASGYSVMLFTLVLILRFGVEPNLQPPSPSPPSSTLRGLYLLASLISAVIGAALGIFFFTFAKYWIAAAGGFSFAWFLLATRHGGLVDNVLGRWGLIGGVTVVSFILGLVPAASAWVTLVATAWIGATAFTLGVDCFTRAGLKEFYIYNLGFHDLFPSLNGFRYPLTQTMQVELGVLAAVVLVGAAIQFRVVGMLQKRLQQMREEEEARIEAEEVSKAAERFKNVGMELSEWEEKHGKNSVASGSMSTATGNAPQLGYGGPLPRRASSTLSLLPAVETKSLYESLPLASPSIPSDTPRSSSFPLSPPTAEDAELESKIRLLAEVQKARKDLRGSIDQLRGVTPTPTLEAGTRSSSRILDYEKPDMTRESLPIATPNDEWEQYVGTRKVIPTSAALSSAPSIKQSHHVFVGEDSRGMERRERTTSMLEPYRRSEWGPKESFSSQNPFSPDSNSRLSPQTHQIRPTSLHNLPLGPPVILGSAAQSQSRINESHRQMSQSQRTLTYDELAARHKKRISKLQEPISKSFKDEMELAEARDKWEKQKAVERKEMERRERERAQKTEGKEVLMDDPKKRADEWRRSVHMGLDTVAQPQPPRAVAKRESTGFAS